MTIKESEITTRRKRAYQAIASDFIKRANGLGYKGRKRDAYAFEFVVGASTMYSICNPDDVNGCSSFVYVISMRGFQGLENYASLETQ